jgi:rod shape-determining protein MreB and related proteins
LRLEGGGVALDLGTAVSRVRAAPRAAPLTRPSVVWRRGGERSALAHGVIADAEAAAVVIADLLRFVPRSRWRRPHVLACVPTDASHAERAALVAAVRAAGAGAVAVVPEPLAAAFGAGLDADGPRARAIIDVGEGVTDCAVVQGGALVASGAVRVGVADMRDSVQRAVAESLHVRITAGEAERVLREAGVLSRRERRRELVAAGIPPRGVGPVLARIDEAALQAALDPVVAKILVHAKRFFAGIEPELRADVADGGICLAGGGALLAGLPERLAGALAARVARAPNPLHAVVDGAHRIAAGGIRVTEWS